MNNFVVIQIWIHTEANFYFCTFPHSHCIDVMSRGLHTFCMNHSLDAKENRGAWVKERLRFDGGSYWERSNPIIKWMHFRICIRNGFQLILWLKFIQLPFHWELLAQLSFRFRLQNLNLCQCTSHFISVLPSLLWNKVELHLIYSLYFQNDKTKTLLRKLTNLQ